VIDCNGDRVSSTGVVIVSEVVVDHRASITRRELAYKPTGHVEYYFNGRAVLKDELLALAASAYRVPDARQ
jgi:hypothetical protein